MKIHFVCSSDSKSQSAYDCMTSRYGQCPAREADCIVALSGDGMLLRTFHENYQYGVPVYGMNRGGLGFLTNEYREENLEERISTAQQMRFHPLRVSVVMEDEMRASSIAVNEVYLLRETHQSAKIRVAVDGRIALQELVCDGLITSSAIGSTAYNYSAGGPIIPSNVPLLALTPISSFRPRRWRGALLPENSVIELEVISPVRRPVCAVADYMEFRKAVKVRIFQDKSLELVLLLDHASNLKDKVFKEQFAS